MPNRTVELVTQWAAFEETHPNCRIEDFCRYYLFQQKEAATTAVPDYPHSQPKLPDNYTKMARTIGRLARMHVADALSCLKSLGLSSFDEFTYLNSIHIMKQPRKTEVISDNMQELSSGLLTLDRLKKKGFIQEYDDSQDGRSKRLRLTSKGTKKLHECHQRVQEINQFFYGSLPEDDLQLCIQLLSPLELKFNGLWHHKKRSGKNKPPAQ